MQLSIRYRDRDRNRYSECVNYFCPHGPYRFLQKFLQNLGYNISNVEYYNYYYSDIYKKYIENLAQNKIDEIDEILKQREIKLKDSRQYNMNRLEKSSNA